jgi:hypothetical protein
VVLPLVITIVVVLPLILITFVAFFRGRKIETHDDSF